MLIKKIQLWEENEQVSLFTYILDNSMEFQVNKKRPCIILCPGGGYLGTSDRESEPVAMRFAAQGYNTFVLRYNTCFSKMEIDFNNLPETNEKAVYPGPLFDLAKAMMIIKENSDEWFVDSDKINICGFSAGAHLAASMGVHWQDELLKERFGVSNEMFKPNVVILGYPLLDYNLMKKEVEEIGNEWVREFWKVSNKAIFGKSDLTEEELAELSPTNYVTSNTPPTFIWHTADDGLVYVSNSLKFAAELTKNKVPYELHIFESGVHGLSLCDETTASESAHINPHCGHWFDLAIEWLKQYQ
ncbi:alpha/beta hydrolase [Clostridium sp. YIM B02505]|uniref:Alpha/beta hydrolase n=1 Tax=Clostridium yunnanense TaxID=2800325 RepID=A0ABS1EVA2_9CLOT|nr:alpha/beta hydrolase [Clostridium yunnanense]MBK1813265.1 alpha/beta hydrolase [Clostridium yunnanense]